MPFRHIAGHRHLLERLASAIVRGALPPSVIFSGAEGVGKRTAALALAQALNCERPIAWPSEGEAQALGAGGPSEAAERTPAEGDPDAQHRGLERRASASGGGAPRALGAGGPSEAAERTPAEGDPDAQHRGLERRASASGGGAPRALGSDGCGECTACRRIARGVHADLLVVQPGDSGTIKVDQIRDAIERSAYRPFEGRRRVVIVNDADALIGEAQNALLKTLEEPPPASVFVLVTARPDLLLPTVRSRCQRLRFGPLSPSEIAGVLIRDHEFSATEAHAAAAAADGSVGRALDRDVDDAAAARDAAARLLTSAASGTDPRRRLDAAKAITAGAAERDALAERLRALSSLLRDMGALQADAADDVLANGDLKPMLQSARRAFNADRVDAAFAAVDRALAALDRNASPKIVADWIALNI